MALPIAGGWAADFANANQYVGAKKWGTGNNPVHEVYGEGPPLRTTGRDGGPDNPTAQLGEVPESYENPALLGYSIEDIQTVIWAGMPPGWDTDITDNRAANYTEFPDWSVTAADPEATEFRNDPEMDVALWSNIINAFPTETVSEGWLNKTSGKVNPAEVSADGQYTRQTSMQQVDPVAGRNNAAAVARATDDPRFSIRTRLTGMKIKPWSQGQRDADMFPFQQETIVRPFWYRQGGTDDPAKMAPNAMVVIDPIQRTVPPDPDLGVSSTNVEPDSGYGYTTEDVIPFA